MDYGHFWWTIKTYGGETFVVPSPYPCRHVEPSLPFDAISPRPIPGRPAGRYNRAVKRKADLSAVGVSGKAQVDRKIQESRDVIGAMSHDEIKGAGWALFEPLLDLW